MTESVFGASDALIVVAIITALGTFLTAVIQIKSKRQNSVEHALVMEQSNVFHKEIRESSQQLQAEVRGVAGDVRDVKADLRALKNEHKETRAIVNEHMKEG